MDKTGLAGFLRRRRDALQPADVGLPPGQRRRTQGLRREEVAGLAGMSTDYYSRLEQERGPQPSEQMLIAITRALRLTMDDVTTCSPRGAQRAATTCRVRPCQPRPAAGARPA